MGEELDALRRLAEGNRDAVEIWQLAEWQCLNAGFAQRLEVLGIEPTPCAGATLIAAAMYLAERTEEWGGDARDALGDLVQLGYSLVDP